MCDVNWDVWMSVSAKSDIQTSHTSHMTDSPESDTQNTFFGTQTSDSAESDTCAQVE